MKTLGDLCLVFFDQPLEKSKEEIDCLKRTLKQFCKTGKKEDAFSVYYCFCEIFQVFGSGYDTMSKLIEFLADHEYHSGELLEKHRDHYSHSVYVFALGLAIYANDDTFAHIFFNFYKNDGSSDTKFLYLWGLVALFHDIGYPFQIAHEQIKAYGNKIWGENSKDKPYVSYNNMDGLLALSPKELAGCRFESARTVDELLAFGIHDRLGYPLPVLLKLLKGRYENQSKYMDHGYFSAVLLARRLTESGIRQDAPILDVLTAVALHNNLNRFDLSRAINKDLQKKKSVAIVPKKHPLAYLLMLCDELQNWDRTAFGEISKKDPLAWTVELNIVHGIIQIAYCFDSFTVLNEMQKGRSSKPERENRNVTVLRKGWFIKNIRKLIKPHTSVEAKAVEREKDKKVRIFASSDSFINLCDFAVAIHKSYQRIYKGPPFEKMSLEFKLSNIEQAKSYADKLELVNCFYSNKELDFPIVKGFTPRNTNDGIDGKRDDLGFLAREEHLRWVKEKLDAGWSYGTDYKRRCERNRKKIHQDIVPYDCLPEKEKKKDELMIQNMVPFLYQYGHGVRIYSYRIGWKPVLDIAGCGHRTIPMHDEDLKEKIKQILREYQKQYRVVVRTNFAFGADQLIARCANELGITIKAAIPCLYEQYIERIKADAIRYQYCFTSEDELQMRHLLAQVVSLKIVPDPDDTYLEASKYIINKSKKMIALWDGVETLLQDENGRLINQGGTWHNICIAKNSRGLKDEDIHIIRCER